MHLNFSTNFPTKDRIFLKKPCALQLRNYSTFPTQLIGPNYSLLIALLQKIVSPLWMVYLFKPPTAPPRRFPSIYMDFGDPLPCNFQYFRHLPASC